MKQQQSTSPQREWGIRRLLLPLFVCLLVMVAGQSRAQDVTSEAVARLREFASQGDAEAQHLLGVCYYFSKGVTQDYAEAAKWFRKAAEQGYAESLFRLGYCYYSGNGVMQNYTEAAKWWLKAAEQGHADAQFNLGTFYHEGKNVTQNYAEAVKWFRKAAEQGHAEAQFNLGICYSNGAGVMLNYAEAVKWWRKAAEQGDADAQFNLGCCYSNGEGVTQDYYEAVKWWHKAAEQGYAMAQFNLGNYYSNGEGITKNYAEAEKWYLKAAEQEDAKAKVAIERLWADEISSMSTSTTVSPKNYAHFFPVHGVLLGKTTLSDVQALGYYTFECFNWLYNTKINTITFWNNHGEFIELTMDRFNAIMPDKWRELGFDWRLSYNEWLALFQSMGFTIEHKKAPEIKEYSGRNTLSAEFVATSPDQTFTMDLTFKYGNENGEGYSTRSKRSLNCISVKLKNKPSVFPPNDAQALSVASVPAVRRYFSDFFPVYGVTIGRSTIADVKVLDYVVKKDKTANIEGLNFWDFDEDRIFEDIRMQYSDPMPEKWQRLGLDCRLSYDEWLMLFRKMGFTIKHLESPATEEYHGRKVLSAEFIATAPDGSFTMRMNFNYGNQNGEGSRTNSRNSLWSITVKKK